MILMIKNESNVKPDILINNGFELSDERMDFLFKEAVRLEIERQKSFQKSAIYDSKVIQNA